jgi:hypothetical protein
MVREINARWFTVRCWPRPRAAAVRSGFAKAIIPRLRLSSSREHSWQTFRSLALASPRPKNVVVIEGSATDVVRIENSGPGVAVMESA